MPEIKGLTINLDADSSGLERGINKITTSLRSTTSLLNQANKALKLDGNNLDAVKQKFSALNQVIPLNQEKLKNLQTELKKLEQLDGGTGQFKDKINRVNGEILKTNTQLKNYQNELNKLNKDYKIKVSADTKEVEVGLNKTNSFIKDADKSSSSLNTSFGSLGGTSKVLGTALTGFVATGAALVGRELINAGKGAISFQKEFGAVRTLLPDAQKYTDKFSQSISGVSKETGVATDQLSKGLYQALSAGVEVTEDAGVATKFLTTATKLSIGGFTSAETAVDTLTTILNAYNLETKDATKISDQLIATQNLGKTTVQQLGATLGNVIPVAADAGVAFDQVGASIATLTAKGIKTDVATTALRNILVELNDNSSKLGESFEKVAKKSFKEFIAEGGTVQGALKLVKEEAERTKTPIGSIVGKETIAAFNTLATSSEEFDKNLAGVRESAGLTEKNFKTSTDNLSDQWNKFMNTIKTGVEEDAKPALDYLTETLKKINEGTFDFGKDVTLPFTKNSLDTIYSVSGQKGRDEAKKGEEYKKTVLDPEQDLNTGMLGLKREKSELNVSRQKTTELNTERVDKVNMMEGGGEAPAPIDWQKEIEAEDAALNSSFEARAEKRNEELEKQQDWFTQLKDSWSNNWNAMSDGWTFWWNGFSSYWGNQWNTLSDNFKGWMDGVKNWWTTKWGEVSSGWSAWWGGFSSYWRTQWNTLSENFKGWMDGVKNWWSTKWNEISSGWSNWSESMKNTFSGWWSNISSWWGDRINDLKNLFGGNSWVQTGKDMINGIINGVKSAGSSLFSSLQDMAGSALNAVKSSLGIKSPSRVFRDVVGKQIPAGIAVGVEANTKQALDSVSSMSDQLVGAAGLNYQLDKAKQSSVFAPSGVATQTTNNTTKSVNINFGNITINGGNTTADTAKKLLEIIERELGTKLGALL